jgi:hypothetical protein
MKGRATSGMALKNCEYRFADMFPNSSGALDPCFFSPTQAEQMQDKPE